MSYWKVTTAADGLPLYAWADNAQHAIRQVNVTVGENVKNGLTLYRAAETKAPDAGTWVIGEPDEIAATRNKEEEF